MGTKSHHALLWRVVFFAILHTTLQGQNSQTVQFNAFQHSIDTVLTEIE